MYAKKLDAVARDRKVIPYISIGVGADSTAMDDVTGIIANGLPMSNSTQLLDANYVMTPGLAVFEADGIPTATARGMIVPPLQAVAYPPEAGLWSDVISDKDGFIDWTISTRLSVAHTCAYSLFTDTAHILEAEITYYDGGVIVRQVMIEPQTEVFSDPAITTFDRVDVHVLKISAPFHHVRIVEMEFGATLTLSPSSLGGELNYIGEVDSLGLSIPLHEVDFGLINVLGEYDVDNPMTKIGTLEKWTPMSLSFTTEVGDQKVTTPIGKFYVTDHKGTDTLLKVTLRDARAILQTTIRPLTVSTGESIGKMYEALLTDLGIPYVIDDAVYQITPTDTVTMDKQEWDILKQVLFIQQRYEVYLLPGRDGYLHVQAGPHEERADDLTTEVLMKFPTPATAKTYNYISVKYGPENAQQTHNIDLRFSTEEGRSAITINNPLIISEEQAVEVANRIVTRLYTQVCRAEAIGDPSIDPNDTVGIDGYWTQGTPTDYKVKSVQMTYDGAFMMTIEGTR